MPQTDIFFAKKNIVPQITSTFAAINIICLDYEESIIIISCNDGSRICLGRWSAH